MARMWMNSIAREDCQNEGNNMNSWGIRWGVQVSFNRKMSPIGRLNQFDPGRAKFSRKFGVKFGSKKGTLLMRMNCCYLVARIGRECSFRLICAELSARANGFWGKCFCQHSLILIQENVTAKLTGLKWKKHLISCLLLTKLGFLIISSFRIDFLQDCLHNHRITLSFYWRLSTKINISPPRKGSG